MIIYIDADACPKPVKEILYKAAHSRQVMCIFVANQPLHHPPSPFIKTRCVDKGFDVADNYIVTKVTQGVITADIPLAKEAIDHGGIVITPYGRQYTKTNIAQVYAMRNFYSELRDAGLVETRTKSFSNQNNNAFSNALDQLLTKAGFLGLGK